MRLPGPPNNQLILLQAVKPMPSWSFKLEWEVFDGVKIITAGHVDMKELLLNPYRRICRAII